MRKEQESRRLNMEKFENRALQFVQELTRKYFEQRDYEELLPLMDPEILLIGTGEDEYINGISEIEAVLRAEQVGSRNSFQILSSEFTMFAIADGICTATGLVEVLEEDAQNRMSPLQMRLSAIIREQDGVLRLWRLHLSTGDAGSVAFPSTISEKGNKQMRRLLNDRSAALRVYNDELKALSNNIPGGVIRCLHNDGFTLLQMSDGFLDMFGYQRVEISALFHDRYYTMIHSDDRERVLAEQREQFCVGDTAELEYRIICRDGTAMWVKDRSKRICTESGEESLYCVLLDITREMRDREELRLSLERHRIIMNQTRDVIFEWDVKDDTLIFSDNWGEKFGYQPITQDISDTIPLMGHLHSEDICNFMELRESMLQGSAYAQTEFRIQKADGDYIWCRARATGQRDDDRRLVKVIGVILDVDAEKRMVKRLQEKAERDALTGLYNKMTAQKRIENALYDSEKGDKDALMILDIDNFKLVNDRCGHLTGDALLVDVASGLKELFRSTDVLGRVGGDEFVVFLHGIPSEAFALERAEKIVNLFHALFQGGMEDVNISCSIGVAIGSSGAYGFQRLYDSADLALYKAKDQGKNQYVLFDAGLDFGRSYVGDLSAVGAIDSDGGDLSSNDRMVSFVLRALYESSDIGVAVSSMLEIVGRQFNVSRVYIIEDSEDGASCSNTFEWCNEGIAPAQEGLQNIPYSTLGDYYANFNEDGIFYCQDVARLPPEIGTVLSAQHIKAVLQCALRDNGKNRGYVGFDECSAQCFWTQEQVDALVLISEILCIFLLKQRAQERMTKTAEQLRDMLDSQNAWIYAIDQETYELLYLNAKTRSLGLALYPGVRCHEAFFGRDTPCEICPRKNKHQGELVSTEIYNPTLRLWTSVDVTDLTWGGVGACLITCYDVTRYKCDEIPPSP